MTLEELYAQYPAAEHGRIIVADDRAYVREKKSVREFVGVLTNNLVELKSDSGSSTQVILDGLSTIKSP